MLPLKKYWNALHIDHLNIHIFLFVLIVYDNDMSIPAQNLFHNVPI